MATTLGRFMLRGAIALPLCVAACRGGQTSPGGASCADTSSSGTGESPDGSGPYHVVHGWPALASGFVLGQVSGVTVDPNGDVVVFHRATQPWFGGDAGPIIDAPTLLRLDGTTGAIVTSFGGGLFRIPHGLRNGSNDTYWVTDVGRNQVFRLSSSGEVLLTIGSGNAAWDASSFNQPTDVYEAPDGSVYVSDGYGNARVVKLDAKGAYVTEWGSPGSGPGQFSTPHSISGDPEGRIYVADRGNARIQRFDSKGMFLDQWQTAALGRPWAVTVASDGFVYVVDGGDQNPAPPDRSRVLRLDRNSGAILDAWSSFGNYDGQLYWGHAVAVASNGDVLVGDVYYGMRVQKFIR